MFRSRTVLRVSLSSLAFVLAACGRDTVTAPGATRISPRHARLISLPPVTVYGPATFTRSMGKPVTDSAVFEARAGDTVTFTFTSGAPQGVDATMTFNGTPLFTVTDTTTLPATARAVAQATNTLKVRLSGKPGSSLTLVGSVPAPTPSSPWWNAVLDFDGAQLPTGWATRLLGGANPGLLNDRLESQPVDNGPWVTSTGPAPAGLLGIVVQYDGQAAQSVWGNGQAIDLWTGSTRNSVAQVNAIYNFGAGNARYAASHETATPVHSSVTVPFSAGDHRYRVVIRQDSVLWSSRLVATNLADVPAAFPSPGWDLTQIDSVGVRAQASDVAAWMDNVRIRAITDLATTATLDLSPAVGTLTVGQSMNLGFEARSISGALLGGKAPTWSSLNTSIATVSSAGVVTGVAEGTVTITAMVDGAIAYASVGVVAPEAPMLPVVQASAKYTHDASGTTLAGDSWSGNPAAVIDGFTNTLYSSFVRIADDADQWWQADLGAGASLAKVRILWQHIEDAWWKQVQVRGSVDGISWTTLVGTSSVNINGSWTEFPVSGNYRYLRVYLMASGSANHGFDMAEFEARGFVP